MRRRRLATWHRHKGHRFFFIMFIRIFLQIFWSGFEPSENWGPANSLHRSDWTSLNSPNLPPFFYLKSVARNFGDCLASLFRINKSFNMEDEKIDDEKETDENEEVPEIVGGNNRLRGYSYIVAIDSASDTEKVLD